MWTKIIASTVAVVGIAGGALIAHTAVGGPECAVEVGAASCDEGSTAVRIAQPATNQTKTRTPAPPPKTVTKTKAVPPQTKTGTKTITKTKPVPPRSKTDVPTVTRKVS